MKAIESEPVLVAALPICSGAALKVVVDDVQVVVGEELHSPDFVGLH